MRSRQLLRAPARARGRRGRPARGGAHAHRGARGVGAPGDRRRSARAPPCTCCAPSRAATRVPSRRCGRPPPRRPGAAAPQRAVVLLRRALAEQPESPLLARRCSVSSSRPSSAPATTQPPPSTSAPAWTPGCPTAERVADVKRLSRAVLQVDGVSGRGAACSTPGSPTTPATRRSSSRPSGCGVSVLESAHRARRARVPRALRRARRREPRRAGDARGAGGRARPSGR